MSNGTVTMTVSQFEDIQEFAQRLPMLRQQISDTQLLDQCQTALNALVQTVTAAAVALVPDPPSTPPETEADEPADPMDENAQ